MEKIKLQEVQVEEIEALEETITPGLGLFCGNSCWGLACF